MRYMRENDDMTHPVRHPASTCTSSVRQIISHTFNLLTNTYTKSDEYRS